MHVSRKEYIDSKIVISGRKRMNLSAAFQDNTKFPVKAGTISIYNSKYTTLLKNVRLYIEIEMYKGHTRGRINESEKSELALSINGSLNDVIKRISVKPI